MMSITSRLFPKLYPSLCVLLGPLLYVWLRIRCYWGKEHKHRLNERWGHPQTPRPDGKLVWLHAASVGESLSALTLINAIRNKTDHADIQFLLTTGTVTSAALIHEKLSPQDIHQFAPIDHPKCVERFLNHWHPDQALWIESELWPNMLTAIQNRAIPAALINARMSPRSFKNWHSVADWAEELLNAFTVILAQSKGDVVRFKALTGRPVYDKGNLKYTSAPLPVDQDRLKAWQDALQGRPTLIYASTHEGEEEIALDIHDRLIEDFPGLISIIIPRHPMRGDAIAALIEAPQWPYLRHSKTPHALPDDKTHIVLADTLGDLGLFYRLAPFAFIGNSLCQTPGGGHNPFEAIQCGCLPICGPLMFNFPQMSMDMQEGNCLKLIQDADHLEACLRVWLESSDDVAQFYTRAKAFNAGIEPILDDILHHITPILKGGA